MTDLTNFVQSRAYLALALLVLVSYLPAMLWGGFVWDDILITQTEPVREAAGLWQIWFSPSDIKVENSGPARRPLLAAGLHDVLAGAQAVGLRASRLSRRQRAAAPRQYALAVASAATAGGARRLGGGRRVRGASAARRVGGLGHRAQGRALRPVLPQRGAGIHAVRGNAATGPLRAGAGVVRRGSAEQIHRGDVACGAAHLAWVEAGARDDAGLASTGAVFRGGIGHHGRQTCEYVQILRANCPWGTPRSSACSSPRAPCGSTWASWYGRRTWPSSTRSGTSALRTRWRGGTSSLPSG